MRFALIFLLPLVSIACFGRDDSLPAPTEIQGETPPSAISPIPRVQATIGQGKELFPYAHLPFGATCPVRQEILAPLMQVDFGPEHFCVAWRDIYDDEEGYRVLVRDGRTNVQRTYQVAGNVNEIYLPRDKWPAAVKEGDCRQCFGKVEYEVIVYAKRPIGEELVDQFSRYGAFVP